MTTLEKGEQKEVRTARLQADGPEKEARAAFAVRVKALSAAASVLAAWFGKNARTFPWRKARTPYKVLVSETMLQQTRIETVLRYYERFMAAFPTLTALAEAPSDLVMKHWEGLGYYSRARHLKEAAERCAAAYGGELPETFDELRKLPGIGDYSAGAIASLCHDEPVPAVDGNVLRVLARFFGDERDVRLPEVRKEAGEIITAVLTAHPAPGSSFRESCHGLKAVADSVRPSVFNEALMELGETLCAPKGKLQCEGCPMKAGCLAHAEGREEQLPFRSAGAARSIEEKTVWIFLCGGRIALEKRPDKGMLRGLYGFPVTEGRVTEGRVTEGEAVKAGAPNGGVADSGTPAAAAYLEKRGIKALTVRPLGPAKHVFTHREWHMTGYLAETREQIPGLTYVTAEELEEAYALPSAFRTYKNMLKIDK